MLFQNVFGATGINEFVRYYMYALVFKSVLECSRTEWRGGKAFDCQHAMKWTICLDGSPIISNFKRCNLRWKF